MTTLRDCITITLRHMPGVDAGPGDVDGTAVGRREAFWRPLMPAATLGGQAARRAPNSAAMDQLFERDFGRHMRGAMLDAMMLHAHEGKASLAPAEGGDPSLDLMRVTFRARVVSYGSLEAALTIGGVEYLAGFFNDNFDSCMIFLEGLIMPSLQQTYTYAGHPLSVDDLRYELRASDALAAHFAPPAAPAQQPASATPVVAPQPPEPPAAQATPVVVSQPPEPPAAAQAKKLMDDARERADRTLRVVTGSFLVPVLLALLVFYVAFLQLNEERARQEAMMTNLLTLQSRLLEEDRARLILAAPGAVATPAPTPAP